jgi:hypothetical protein
MVGFATAMTKQFPDSLKSLKLAYNPMQDVGVAAISSLLWGSVDLVPRGLTILSLSNCDMSDVGGLAIVGVLQQASGRYSRRQMRIEARNNPKLSGKVKDALKGNKVMV